MFVTICISFLSTVSSSLSSSIASSKSLDIPQTTSLSSSSELDVLQVCNVEPESTYSVTDPGVVMIGKRLAFDRNLRWAPTYSHIWELKQFYSQGINHNRSGGSLQDSTVNKMIEQVSLFLWFVKKVKRIEPVLVICGNVHTVQDVIRFASKKQNIKAITCSRYVSVFISIIKFLNASPESPSVTDRSVEQLSTLWRTLESEHRKQHLFEQATRPLVNRKEVYPEILELCQELKWQLEELRGLEWARCACLFLIYSAANLWRAEEFFTLHILSGQSTKESRDQNFICCDTHYAYGPNRIDLPKLSFLTKLSWPNNPFWRTIYICTIRNSALSCSWGMRKTFYFWLRAGLHFLHLIPTYQHSSRNTFQ